MLETLLLGIRIFHFFPSINIYIYHLLRHSWFLLILVHKSIFLISWYFAKSGAKWTGIWTQREYILKGQCQLRTLWQSMYSKKSWQGAHFLEHWLLGSGARKPRRKPEGSALKPLPSTFCGVLRLTNQFIQNHQKASVKSIAVWKGKFISYLGKVCVCVFFTNTVSQKP